MAVRMRSFIRIAQWWGGVHSKPYVCLVKPSQAFWAPEVWVTWLPPVNVYIAMKFHGFPSIFTIYNVSLKTGNQPSPSVQYGTWSHFLLWRSHGPTSSVSPAQDLSRFSGKVTGKRKSIREIGGNWVCNIQNPLFMRLSASWACYELTVSSGISVIVCMSVLTSGFIPYQGSPGHLKMHQNPERLLINIECVVRLIGIQEQNPTTWLRIFDMNITSIFGSQRRSIFHIMSSRLLIFMTIFMNMFHVFFAKQNCLVVQCAHLEKWWSSSILSGLFPYVSICYGK